MRDRATANDVPFTPLDKLFEPTVPKGPELPMIDTLPVSELHPFQAHPFHLYTDEKLPEAKLKEFVGHTLLQVIAGILLGVANTFIMYYCIL